MTTEHIWRQYEAGFGVDDIRKLYPNLRLDQIHAALEYEQLPHRQVRRWWQRNGVRVVRNRDWNNNDDW